MDYLAHCHLPHVSGKRSESEGLAAKNKLLATQIIIYIFKEEFDILILFLPKAIKLKLISLSLYSLYFIAYGLVVMKIQFDINLNCRQKQLLRNQIFGWSNYRILIP